MKKSILSMIAFAFSTGTILTSCNTSAERVEKAQTNVIEAKKELNDANQAYLADIENYRKEMTIRIAANQTSIDAFNERISKEKKAVRAEYKKKVGELELKNNDMKKTMDDYKADGKEKWEKFKSEFSQGMDDLSKAFQELTGTKV
jgi:chromosome segregation ATPase